MSSIKVGLGTAQWGMSYGISNSYGQTRGAEIEAILDIARKAGIFIIDTAALYGNAEQALGAQNLGEFQIVTKTPRFAKPEITVADAKQLVTIFLRSLELLGVERVYGLLVHHSDDLLAKGGEYLGESLFWLKEKGLIQNIGISIYDSQNLSLLCEQYEPDIVQMPINVFDQRLIDDGSVDYLYQKGIEIHARSIFLQGLLLMEANQIPSYFQPWRSILESWHSACKNMGVTPMQAALNFVANLDNVKHCIVGVESASQLKEILHAMNNVTKFNASEISCSDVNLINPINWRLE